MASRGRTGIAVLDNPIWHAIDGPRGHLAQRTELAGRFPIEISVFAGIADTSPDAWHQLAELSADQGWACVSLREVHEPDGWRRASTINGVQMVAGDVTADRSAIDLVELGTADVPEMIELVNATRPGPFGPRTIEFGGYIGHRVDGRLVAMAGERMRCEGFTEISAVCTDPAHRGKGLGAALVLTLVDSIRARGEEAFLHAADDNLSAIRLYETLGFEHNGTFEFPVLQTPKAG